MFSAKITVRTLRRAIRGSNFTDFNYDLETLLISVGVTDTKQSYVRDRFRTALRQLGWVTAQRHGTWVWVNPRWKETDEYAELCMQGNKPLFNEISQKEDN